MALLTNNWYVDTISFTIIAASIFVTWVKWSHQFWERLGIPTPKTHFFFGHAKDLFFQTESFADFTLRLYEHFKKEKLRHGGTYMLTLPSYMPVDLEIVKGIMQTDFDHFVDRGVYVNEETDPLSAHLFSLEGTKWRNLRTKLTPTFTSGKMKMMFETLVKCGDELIVQMDKKLDNGPLDAKEVLSRLTTDIIGNCAFGLDCSSLQNPDDELYRNFQNIFVGGFWENLRNFFSFVAPNAARKLGVRITKPQVEKFFMRVIKDMVEYRETNDIYRKDFMYLLLQLKNELALTMNELAAQAFVFLLAGSETCSTTLTFCLYELATNPTIQEKLRQEIEQVLEKYDDKLTYEAMVEMHYMNNVINETLRKYPPLGVLNRICTKDWRIPGTDTVLKKGTSVGVPILGIQRDPDYYPDPEKFEPERFSEENKRKRPAFTFLPFGEGPRICIALRFGMLQTKVGLWFLLKNYKFHLNCKTRVPFKLDPRALNMSPEGGIWLDYTKV